MAFRRRASIGTILICAAALAAAILHALNLAAQTTPGGSNGDNQINVSGAFGADSGIYTYILGTHTLNSRNQSVSGSYFQNATNPSSGQLHVVQMNNTAPTCPDGSCDVPWISSQVDISQWGPGKNIGNPSGVSAGAGWRVGNAMILNQFGNIAGIQQTLVVNQQHHGVGDSTQAYLGPSINGFTAGGQTGGSDQGVSIITGNSTQYTTYCQSTIALTTGQGDTAPVVTCPGGDNGANALVNGGYIIDMSNPVAFTMTGTVTSAWNGSNALGIGLLPVSGISGAVPNTGICQTTQYINPSTILNVPQSQTVTCPTISGTMDSTTNNGYVWIYSTSGPEQLHITNVSGSTITFEGAVAHAIGSYIFEGGTQGLGVMPDEYTFGLNTTDYNILGASDSTHLIIGFRNSTAMDLPHIGYQFSRVGSTIDVLQGCMVMFLAQDGVTAQCELNNVPWAAGDSFRAPGPSNYKEYLAWLISTQHTSVNPSDPGGGVLVEFTASGDAFGHSAFQGMNINPSSLYDQQGGRLAPPTFITNGRSNPGTWGSFASFMEPAASTLAGDCQGHGAILCNLGGITRGTVPLYSDNVGGEIVLDRTLNTIDFPEGYQLRQIGQLGSSVRIGEDSNFHNNNLVSLNGDVTNAGYQGMEYGPMAGPGGIPVLFLKSSGQVQILSPLVGMNSMTASSASVLASSVVNDVVTFDNTTGHLADSGLQISSVIRLLGTTSTIGGSPLIAGTCSTGTATVTGAVVGHAVSVSASDGALPNPLVVLSASATAANTVSVQLCAIAAVTPAAVTYNVATY